MHNPIPIKVAMVKKEINGERLAELAGLSRPTVSRIVNGKRVMPDKLKKALDVLELSMAEVYAPREKPAGVAA